MKRLEQYVPLNICFYFLIIYSYYRKKKTLYFQAPRTIIKNKLFIFPCTTSINDLYVKKKVYPCIYYYFWLNIILFLFLLKTRLSWVINNVNFFKFKVFLYFHFANSRTLIPRSVLDDPETIKSHLFLRCSKWVIWLFPREGGGPFFWIQFDLL